MAHGAYGVGALCVSRRAVEELSPLGLAT
ncbi:MAG: hypothetical protein MGAcid_19460 [uncultured Acidilobus sp. MG]|nr:MAG: hypothetical protein MGAcid_19460 [uncultured Acidilobus sp. MG]